MKGGEYVRDWLHRLQLQHMSGEELVAHAALLRRRLKGYYQALQATGTKNAGGTLAAIRAFLDRSDADNAIELLQRDDAGRQARALAREARHFDPKGGF